MKTPSPVSEPKTLHNLPQPEDMALQLGAKKVHEARRFSYEMVQQYRDSFKNPDTGRFHNDLLESRPCPVCLGTESHEIMLKDGGRYVKCDSCSMVFLNPVFTDEALQRYYTNNNTAQAQITKNETDFYRRLFTKGLERVMAVQSSGAILDIGCSSGFFLDIAKEQGWKTFGIELNTAEAAHASQAGHDVKTSLLSECKFSTHFNAITMWDVLEHIKDGSQILKSIYDHLVPKGVLFLQIPNSAALAPRILRERCRMFDGLEHVNLYSPKTIQLLADRTGFVVRNIETVISEIPIIANYLAYEDPYYGEAEHNGKVLEVLDEATLHKNLLGYKMQVVLQRS